ncbi:MAG: transposase [Candidatus Omnitrophica bacterium]|nr:transposase [Candidatus Omnitrophota bacterium]
MMRRAYKFRVWTNTNQTRELGIMLETHRRLYNACLEQRKTACELQQHRVTYSQQSAWFKAQRNINPYFAHLNFSSAQATMRRLDKTFKTFFRRAKAKEKPGYPRFKSRGQFNSIEFPAYGDGIRLTGDRLRVQHVGKLRVKVHRPVIGTVKTATLKYEVEKWYLILSCDLGDVHVQPSLNPPVGIDVGLEAFFTASDGAREPWPNYLRTALPLLRRYNRSVSRKQKGGANRRKAVFQLARFYVRTGLLQIQAMLST